MAVITESFDKADSDTLGPDLTWVEDEGDFDVASNKAVSTATHGLARPTTALDSSDHYAQAVCASSTGTTGSPGVIVRKTASATLTYYVTWVQFSTQTTAAFTVVANVFTSWGAGVATTLSAATNYTVKLTAEGDQISSFVDAVQKFSVTRTTVPLTAITGIREDSVSGTITIDNFEAGDIVEEEEPSTELTPQIWM